MIIMMYFIFALLVETMLHCSPPRAPRDDADHPLARAPSPPLLSSPLRRCNQSLCLALYVLKRFVLYKMWQVKKYVKTFKRESVLQICARVQLQHLFRVIIRRIVSQLVELPFSSSSFMSSSSPALK